jgi:hypothetical protein
MKVAVTVILLIVARTMPARAASLTLQLWRLCEGRYQAALNDIGTNWKVLGFHFGDGRTWRQRMARTKWAECFCWGTRCDCCEHDITKVCAFVAHRTATTKDAFRFLPCEQG